MEKQQEKNTTVQRVDFQVTVLVAIAVLLSGTILFSFSYSLGYNEMLSSLEERANAIASYLDHRLDIDIFQEIRTASDMKGELYDENHLLLTRVREVASAKNLYTVIRNRSDQYVYHLDGLLDTSAHFRKVGSLIEDEFIPDVHRAFQGEVVIADDILRSERGDLYDAYYPMYSQNGAIMGVLVVEFIATRQYDAYRNSLIITFFILIITCTLAAIFAYFLFRRISNPHFRDIFNTDSLTGLKNRNAFDLDARNYIQSKRMKGCALLLADLNGLKVVNDQYGHKQGDQYIKTFAKALTEVTDLECISYRIGGDEFAVLFLSATEQDLEDYMLKLHQLFENMAEGIIVSASASMGYAFCMENTPDAWEAVQEQADIELYDNKRTFYNTQPRNRRSHIPSKFVY